MRLAIRLLGMDFKMRAGNLLTCNCCFLKISKLSLMKIVQQVEKRPSSLMKYAELHFMCLETNCLKTIVKNLTWSARTFVCGYIDGWLLQSWFGRPSVRKSWSIFSRRLPSMSVNTFLDLNICGFTQLGVWTNEKNSSSCTTPHSWLNHRQSSGTTKWRCARESLACIFTSCLFSLRSNLA